MSFPTITPFTVVPSRSDSPAEFANNADQFLGELPNFQEEINAFAEQMNQVATADPALVALASTANGFGADLVAGAAREISSADALREMDEYLIAGSVIITSPYSLGPFVRDPSDTTSADDGVNVIRPLDFATRGVFKSTTAVIRQDISGIELGLSDVQSDLVAEQTARVSADNSLDARVDSLEATQGTGRIAYQTLALLNADLVHDANTLAEVTNDPTPANNGTYIKVGASGAGSWLKSTNDLSGRVSNLEDEVDDINSFVGGANLNTIAYAAQNAAGLGIVDAERLNDIQLNGVYLDFMERVFAFGATAKASAGEFSQLTFTRSSTALALDADGVYQSFAINALRETSRGALLEAAATNLHGSPVVISGSGWAASGQSLATGVSSPDGGSNATTVTQTGASDPGRTYSVSLPVATYRLSFVLKRAAIRYTLIYFSGAGLGAVTGNCIDWDAVGGPTFSAAGGVGGYTGTVQELDNGYYRFSLTLTTVTTENLVTTIRTSSDGTYTNRGLGASAGTAIWTFWHAQIEAGTVTSSPILVGGATRSADAAQLDITGFGSSATDDDIYILHEGSVATFKRSMLADPNIINLITDGGGAWLKMYIEQIALIPAAVAGYRTVEQQKNDSAAALIGGALRPIEAAVRRLLADNGSFRPARIGVDGDNDRIDATDTISTPHFVIESNNYYWNGQIFGNEADLHSAAGGIVAGQLVTYPGVIESDADLLGGVTFASTKEGFTNTSNSTTAVNAGKLEMTTSGSPATFSRNVKGHPGKAFRFSIDARRTAAGLIYPGFSEINAALGAARLGPAAGLTETTVTVTCAPVLGENWWIGGYFGGGAAGISYWDNPTLKEIAPTRQFPNGNFWAFWSGVIPNPLPASTEVLFQGDIGEEKDRWRVELRSTGDIYVRRDLGLGVTGATFTELLIGTVTGAQSVKIAAGMSRSQLIGAVNGSGNQVDIVGANGFSSFRLGGSSTGSNFTGTRSSFRLYGGIETMEYMERITRITAASSAIQAEGDSYMVAGSTGLSLMLSDLDYELQNRAVGGSTFTQQYDRIIAATDLYDLTLVWWDGSPNGHTEGGGIATELAQIAAVVAALGHSRWLYVRSGQISNPISGDMTTLYNSVAQIYGSVHVYDAQPIVATFAISNPAEVGYANDQSDLAAGSYPRSTLYDGVHLRPDVRRAITLDIQRSIEAVRRL